jgi:hypothetical protein
MWVESGSRCGSTQDSFSAFVSKPIKQYQLLNVLNGISIELSL